MSHRVICWILIFITQVGFGQNATSSLYFDHLTINDGLSHNTIFSILQDQSGYIWIGTQNGLNKYDGYSFEVFQSHGIENNQSGFKGKHISTLFEDKAGNLWVGTKKNGINFKKKSSDRFVNLQSDSSFISIKDVEISSLFEDTAGHIWISTVGLGVVKYHPTTKSFQIFNKANSQLSTDVTFDVVEDKYGTIWVAAEGGGLNYLANDNQFALSHEMLPNNPNMSGYRKKLLLDDEYLWVGTQGTGLYKMNLKDKSYIHFSIGNEKKSINSNAVMDLFKAKDGRLFIVTEGNGLNIYDPILKRMSFYKSHIEEQIGLNSNSLLCLFVW